MVKTFEIFWNDLTNDCQQRIQEFLNMDEDDNGNYDVFPLATFEVEEDALKDGTETGNSD